MKHRYFNLTQSSGHRVVYLRSTDIEQKNYHRLLWSVPDEWLYLLMVGDEIEVVDISSNKGKIEHIFIPILNDLLNHMSGTASPQHNNLKEHLSFAMNALNSDSSLSKKYSFWCDRFESPVNIKAKTFRVDREPNPLAKHQVTCLSHSS
jgi:hypothetical protein